MGPDLIDRAKRGDTVAFTTLALQLGDRLYCVAYRIQTFLIAWRELLTLRDAGPVPNARFRTRWRWRRPGDAHAARTASIMASR